MILTGNAIRAAVDQGLIEIDPYDPAHLNPASYDLTLGAEFATYTTEEQTTSRTAAWKSSGKHQLTHEDPWTTLDSAKKNPLTVSRMDPSGFELTPNRLYLMHTAERIHTKRFVPIIDGKSSIGRLGIFVHVTAGYGDPGFNGQYTLEVATIAHPVIIYPGMRFCQIRFHAMQGEANDYSRTGSYVGADAQGPVRSSSWRQFVKG